MLNFLNNIRSAEKKISLKRQIINTAAIALLGIALGALSKFLDTVPVNHLPALLQYLDVTNFLGRFAIWIFLAVCISVYSLTSVRAAINVFLFFTGMILSYYFILNIYSRLFPEKLCDDLDRLYRCFTVACLYLLVCEGSRQNIAVSFRGNNSCPF